MTQWSNDAQKYLDGYLMQVAAIARANGDDADEITENLREHVANDLSRRSEGNVELHHVRAVLVSLGSPDEVCGADLSEPLLEQRAVFLSKPSFRWAAVIALVMIGMTLPFGIVFGMKVLSYDSNKAVVAGTVYANPEGKYTESDIRSTDAEEFFQLVSNPDERYHGLAPMWALINKMHWADSEQRRDIAMRALEIAQDESYDLTTRYRC